MKDHTFAKGSKFSRLSGKGFNLNKVSVVQTHTLLFDVYNGFLRDRYTDNTPTNNFLAGHKTLLLLMASEMLQLTVHILSK